MSIEIAQYNQEIRNVFITAISLGPPLLALLKRHSKSSPRDLAKLTKNERLDLKGQAQGAIYRVKHYEADDMEVSADMIEEEGWGRIILNRLKKLARR